jgi:hypothetical protein
MKRITSAAAVAFALIYPAFHAAPAVAQAPANLQNPLVDIAYVQPTNPAFRPIYDRLVKLQVLEELRQFLAPLRLPRKLTVRVEQCGAATRPFKPQGPAVICYEMIDQIEKFAAKANENSREIVVVGTFVQAVFHEIAHAIFDILQAPVWGREEDAADRLTAFMMLQFGEAPARKTIGGTATFFALSNRTWTGSAFANVAAPEAQRYFNFLCIAYGGAPKSFEYLVKAEKDKAALLPEDRARRCPGEYAQVRKAFNLRIMPYVDPDLFVKSRAVDWKLSAR